MKAGIWIIGIVFILGIASWKTNTNTEDHSGWLTIEEALKLQETNPKKWFVDVYTDWCGWCKRMDATTFKDETILKELDEHYYKIRFDAEYKETIVIGDKEYKFVSEGRRGYHELAKQLLQGRMSYPTVVFLDEDVNIIQPLPGFRPAKELHPILQFIGEDHYKTTTWESFQETYQSPASK